MAAFAVVVLVIVSVCNAEFIDYWASLVPRKTVATSYLTIGQYSSMRCVRKCYGESLHGRCSIAAFNKATNMCHLSMNSQQYVVDISGDTSDVYVLQHGPQTQGIYNDIATLS